MGVTEQHRIGMMRMRMKRKEGEEKRGRGRIVDNDEEE